MIVLFGTKSKLKVVKPLGVGICENCHHEVEKSLAKEKTSLHIFFIPFFTRTSSKFILCPCCGESKKLTGAEFKQLKQGN